MTHILTPPSRKDALKRFAARMKGDPDSRSVGFGILAVLVIHFLLFLFAPYLLRTDAVRHAPRKPAAPRQFNIEIAPDAFVTPPPKPPNPNKYIEANPNAPDKVPDQTNNFSSQNQQLAQEKPQPDQHNDKPKLDGKKDINSNQTVSGQLTKPQDSVPVSQPVTTPNKTQSAPKQEQNPLAGYEKMKDGADGFGSNLGSRPDIAKPMPDKIDGAKDAPVVEGPKTLLPSIDPKKPRARPVLEQTHTRPAVFQDNQFGTSNIGPVAVSAKWSSYGAYLHKMMEAIQVQWDRLLMDSRTEPPSGTTVTVKFTMDSKGKITEILDVENTSSEQGKQSCITAITMTAPYGDWTDDMIAVLGNSQELTFQFYYQ
ncbi:MAG TPA: hypothetical protein VII09_06375 [Opitutaceae bacterium]